MVPICIYSLYHKCYFHCVVFQKRQGSKHIKLYWQHLWLLITTGNNFDPLKGYTTEKWKCCHHLLTLNLLTQTCMSFFLLLLNTKEVFFEERLDPNSCLAPLTSILLKSMVPKFQSFFKISSFVFSRKNKLILVCNNLRVSKW